MASTSQQNTQRPPHKHEQASLHSIRSFLHTPWRAEILSCVLSATALACIVAIAHSRDGKIVPDWYFSVNFLISVFSSIFKAALLLPTSEAIGELKWLWFADSQVLSDIEDFDSASRGPRGSLAFLFRLPRNKLVSLGALVTVLAIGSDPLTQLVIQNRDCFEEQVNMASINRANNYTAFGSRSGNWWMIDPPISLALYQGTLSPPANSTSDLPVDCSTGNCVFAGQYSALEMCYSVSNLSEQSEQMSAAEFPGPNGEILTTEQMVTSNGTHGTPLFQFKATARSWTETSKSWRFKAGLHRCVKTYSEVKISSYNLEQRLLSTVNLVRVEWGELPYYSLVGDFPSNVGKDCSPSKMRDNRRTLSTKKLKNGTPFIPPQGRVASQKDWSDASLVASQDQTWYDPACVWHFGMEPTQALPATLGEGLFGNLGNRIFSKVSME